AVWDCKYHIGWCSKYRSRILKGEVAKSVVEISQQLCDWKKSWRCCKSMSTWYCQFSINTDCRGRRF
ncbi:MAG: transposase, partial [Deltaproteobacteria bacterium]|nr:transposase [Deltaproteobacteria bacterium]